MNSSIKKYTIRIISFYLLLVTIASADDKTHSFSLNNWLLLGPGNVYQPVFNENATNKIETGDLLESEFLKIKEILPQQNESLIWFDGERLKWVRLISDSIVFQPEKLDTTAHQMACLATYIKTERWCKTNLNIETTQQICIYLDGQQNTAKSGAKEKSGAPENKDMNYLTAELKLTTGKHLLLLKTIFDPKSGSYWTVKANIEMSADYEPESIQHEINPDHIFQIEQLLDGPKISNVLISPDGELVAVLMQQNRPPGDDSESWIEIRRFKDNALLHTYRGGMKLSAFQWAPTGKRFSYKSHTKEEQTLWLVDLENGTAQTLLKDVTELRGYTWAPDGKFIIYSVTEKDKPDKTGVKKLKNLRDRWHNWRDKSFLYQVTVPGGIKRRLTVGGLSTDLLAIHPNGSSLLFARTVEDYSTRPYSKTELYRLYLTNLTIKKIWEGSFFNSVGWSPDGQQLLVLAGPSAFGELGLNVPSGKIPNDYDTQAYIFDAELKNGEAITKNFDPTISQAKWSRADGCIYFNMEDRAFKKLYQYNPGTRKFKNIKTDVDVVNNFSLAEKSLRLVYSGSGVSQPTQAYAIDLKKDKSFLLADPESESMQHVKFGKSEPWHFGNGKGVQIDGRIYYPPDFNQQKKYPCIVYYYGGTSPVSRNFGGRYPKELWAANGYVVYVLQPSGATGFGQAFSALHVNDWGKIVVEEIITGTKQFLDAHPFVDRQRVGCIGASYGGFMTMLLLTRTDIFAAAVSHAGISAISSYWGEGYWGYLYSAVATANSFPWNRKDIYVDQSPLFSADKITTPLLLTHGGGDTNVPPGESEQMYIALKLLGKEVEYLKVAGQNHWIMNPAKRKLWTNSIIAWFDKWLKEQPPFWNDLYPPEN